MRSRLFLLIACVSVIFAGCKKDKDDSYNSVKKQIIATWELQSANAVYYDASGKQVNSQDLGTNPETQFEFVNETTLKSNGKDYTYSLTDNNGKATINVDNQDYQVKITGSTMTWVVDTQLQDETYARSVVTYQFKKL